MGDDPFVGREELAAFNGAECEKVIAMVSDPTLQTPSREMPQVKVSCRIQGKQPRLPKRPQIYTSLPQIRICVRSHLLYILQQRQRFTTD